MKFIGAVPKVNAACCHGPGGLHAGHEPPQSTPVSSPFWIRSEQVGGVPDAIIYCTDPPKAVKSTAPSGPEFIGLSAISTPSLVIVISVLIAKSAAKTLILSVVVVGVMVIVDWLADEFENSTTLLTVWSSINTPSNVAPLRRDIFGNTASKSFDGLWTTSTFAVPVDPRGILTRTAFISETAALMFVLSVSVTSVLVMFAVGINTFVSILLTDPAHDIF